MIFQNKEGKEIQYWNKELYGVIKEQGLQRSSVININNDKTIKLVDKNSVIQKKFIKGKENIKLKERINRSLKV